MSSSNHQVIRRLTHILFYFSGLILLLHNITPHVHSEFMAVDQDEEPSSLVDWLVFAFQIDPGAGHLECFSKPDQIDIQNSPHQFTSALVGIDHSIEYDRPLELQVLASRDTCEGHPLSKRRTTASRGPPA